MGDDRYQGDITLVWDADHPCWSREWTAARIFTASTSRALSGSTAKVTASMADQFTASKLQNIRAAIEAAEAVVERLRAELEMESK